MTAQKQLSNLEVNYWRVVDKLHQGKMPPSFDVRYLGLASRCEVTDVGTKSSVARAWLLARGAIV